MVTFTGKDAVKQAREYTQRRRTERITENTQVTLALQGNKRAIDRVSQEYGFDAREFEKLSPQERQNAIAEQRNRNVAPQQVQQAQAQPTTTNIKQLSTKANKNIFDVANEANNQQRTSNAYNPLLNTTQQTSTTPRAEFTPASFLNYTPDRQQPTTTQANPSSVFFGNVVRNNKTLSTIRDTVNFGNPFTPENREPAIIGLTAVALFTPIPGDELIIGAPLISKVPQAWKAVKQLPYLQQALVRSGIGFGVAQGTQFTGDVIERNTRTPTEKSAIQSAGLTQKDIKQVFAEANEFERKEINRQGIAKNILYEVPFGGYLAGGDSSFIVGAVEALKKRGLSDNEINNVLPVFGDLRNRRASSELAGILTSGVDAESIGRLGSALGLSKLGNLGVRLTTQEAIKEVPRIVATNSIIPGIIEGVGSEVNKQLARERDITTKENLINIGIAGGAGAISAPLFNYFIVQGEVRAAAGITGKTQSRLVSGLGNILDPSEIITDKIADIEGRALKQLTGFELPTPRIRTTQTPLGTIFNFGSSSTGNNFNIGSSSSPILNNPVPDFIVNVGEAQQTRNKNQETTKINQNVPNKENPQNFIFDNFIQLPVAQNNQQSQQQRNEQFTNQIPLFVNTTQLSFASPFPRIPPPLPLSFGDLGGGFGGNFGLKNNTFINELNVSRTLFSNLTGSGIFAIQKKKGKSKRRRKR